MAQAPGAGPIPVRTGVKPAHEGLASQVGTRKYWAPELYEKK